MIHGGGGHGGAGGRCTAVRWQTLGASSRHGQEYGVKIVVWLICIVGDVVTHERMVARAMARTIHCIIPDVAREERQLVEEGLVRLE